MLRFGINECVCLPNDLHSALLLSNLEIGVVFGIAKVLGGGGGGGLKGSRF